MNKTHYIYNNIVAMLLLIGAAMPLHAQTIKGKIYGGGELATVDGNTYVQIKTGKIDEDVYGGGALANVEGNTKVDLSGGTLNSAYGGGLGSKIGVNDATKNVEALVGGSTLVKLNGSVVNGNVFGCNNVNGTPKGHAKVHVLSTAERDDQGAEEYDVAAVYGGGNLAAYNPNLDSGNGGDAEQFAEVLIENCDNSIEYVYGGGNAAPVPATKVTIKGANAIGNAFAGGNGAGDSNPGADIGYLGFFSSGVATEYGTGVASINILGGTIHHVYGGSNTLGYIKDHAEVNVNDAGECTMNVSELYGGGKKAPGKAATINITCTGEDGKIDNVYGGAHMADLTGDITLNIHGGNIGNAFGGNNESGNIDGTITVNVNWTTGDGECGTNNLNNVYGGGNLAPYTTPDGKLGPAVNILYGTVSQNVYGGGLGGSAIVTGNPVVTIDGGTVDGNVFGGGNEAKTVGNTLVTMQKGDVGEDIYGGGALADVDGNTIVKLLSGKVTGSVYGGGLGQLASTAVGDPDTPGYKPAKENIAATVTGNTLVQLGDMVDDGTGNNNLIPSGDASVGNIFGCNNYNGAPNGSVVVDVISGLVTNNVYGGGNLAAASVSPIVNINGGTSSNVFGGGYGVPAVLTGNPTVNINGGTVTHDVYGGGALANVSGSTKVNLYGGAVGNAYGGGLGQLAADAVGTEGELGYKPAKEAIEAIVGGNTNVTLGKMTANDDGTKTYTATKVTGDGIFGANNINGTPLGHAFVHVIKTVPRSTNENLSDAELNKPDVPDSYDVPAVYGGGNLSAYEPSQATLDARKGYAEVLIENCDNSIAYVYGGGNAAPVPATEVTVYGADAIDYLFGGGNGSGAGNPGANIGLKTDNTTAYGAGTVNVKIYGGTIHEVFGGSNTKGLIRTSANVSVAGDPDETDDIFPCDLNVGNVHGGGNKADMLCGGTITLACTQGVDVVYAGAEAADIHGDINLTIASGTYTKVFGGNNLSGNVYGSIKINIDETGCFPIIIGDLYGGGNEAAYSVYGYNDDGSPKESSENPSADPTINIISCTSIGNVYGGGYGATAKMYGNPTINVNMLEGAFAGKEMDANSYYILNGTGERVLNTAGTIPNDIGTIGAVYGGGEQAAVEGDTRVNICTEATIKHLGSSAEGVIPKANITGDVYGGGKGAFDAGGNLIDAYVSGSTNVKIGKAK